MWVEVRLVASSVHWLASGRSCGDRGGWAGWNRLVAASARKLQQAKISYNLSTNPQPSVTQVTQVQPNQVQQSATNGIYCLTVVLLNGPFFKEQH